MPSSTFISKPEHVVEHPVLPQVTGYITDVFSKSTVESVIGSMAGTLGGMLLVFSAGYLITWTYSYEILFILAAGIYGITLLIIYLSLPVIRPINVS